MTSDEWNGTAGFDVTGGVLTSDEWNYTAGIDVTGGVLTSDEWKNRQHRNRCRWYEVMMRHSSIAFGYIDYRSVIGRPMRLAPR